MSPIVEEFEVDSEARDGDLWVLPRGELDLAGAPELREALSLAVASDAAAIVVDLRGLELLDSTGLRVLLEARSGEGGERISFVPGNDLVQGVFRISGLLEELPFRPG
jgi:anti-sigma B factor antagonist